MGVAETFESMSNSVVELWRKARAQLYREPSVSVHVQCPVKDEREVGQLIENMSNDGVGGQVDVRRVESPWL